MNQGLHLSAQLTQSLMLSPQLQQSLALLQAPLLELKALVEKELEQNPVLEEVPAAEAEQQRRAEETGESAASSLDPTEPPKDVLFDPATEKTPSAPVDEFDAEFGRLAQLDQEWREHFAQAGTGVRATPEDEERRQHMFDSLTRSESLQEALMDQVRLSELAEAHRKLAELIVGNIDDDGWLKASLDELAASASVPNEEVETVLRVIQSFDPAGVGARDLRECLLLQLQRVNRADSLEYRIIEQHMDLLARRRVPDLAAALGATIEDIQAAMGRIAHLQPKPGRSFAAEPEQYVVPEVFVEQEGDRFVVSVNNADIPHLRVSNLYKDLMTRGRMDLGAFEAAFDGADGAVQPAFAAALKALGGNDSAQARLRLNELAVLPELTNVQSRAVQHARNALAARDEARTAREYVRDKIGAAKFLIKSIDLRQKTLLNISREIVRRQHDFFARGREALKPMTMGEVAEVVGVHETTVSRAVAGKYMDCPQGLIELRSFFTAGLQTSEGPAIANTSVKEMVAELFKGEDPHSPLSDDTVAKMLQARGIHIARRTVMKYRDLLGIPSSSLRKVY
jgi:RNA polymerase sigma-54 factor